MPTFPTLSRTPNTSLCRDGYAGDGTLRTTFENGAILTRNRFTATPRIWERTWNMLTNEDKDALEAFQETVNFGGDSFTWVDEVRNRSHTVRFGKPLDFKMEPMANGYWQLSVTLVEA